MLYPTAAQRLPRAPAPSPRPARSRARGRHRALAPWALAAAARLCHVRRAKREAPDFQSFSEDLLVVIQDAEKSAATLKQGQIGTDALLLSLLSASREDAEAAYATVRAAFPDVEPEAVAGYLQQRAEEGEGASSSPMPFTPMARRTLQAAAEQREDLGHEATEPAHLLLALLEEQNGQSNELLEHFGQSKEEVRKRVLATLKGALAKLRLMAAQRLAEIRRDLQEEEEESHFKEPSKLFKKISNAHRQLIGGLVERSVESKLMLLAALSGEHLFLLGPPGTAKSLLARRLADVCKGSFFERLLTRFSVPEEVFGPLSLKALEKDRLRRKVEGFLPTADVAFLDEIFKANSSILNALLTLLNERRFDNGGERVDVPLWCAVAASNELPESDELEALFDRFLLRREVPRVSDAAVPSFLRSALEAEERDVDDEPMLTVLDSSECQRKSSETKFPGHLLDVVVQLRAYLRDEAEPPVLLSDRRLGKAVRLLRLAAWAVGADEVSEVDLLLLQHMCWDKEPSQAAEVRVWLLDHLNTVQEDGGDADMLEKLKFLLNGVKMRLQRKPRSGGTISMAEKDLGGMREVLEEAFRMRQRRLLRLRSITEKPESPRLFWAEQTEVEDLESALLPSLESSAQRCGELLQEVLQLREAVGLNHRVRDSCLDALVEGDEEMEGRLRSEAEKRMPRDGFVSRSW